MDLHTLRLLLSPAGQPALRQAVALTPRETDFLTHFQVLSQRFPAELAKAALETAILRLEASNKFPFADQMYFTRQALEQATSHEVASYRADRFRPFPRLVDLGCSIGSDTIAMLQVAPTIGLDHDRLRLALASANLSALGSSERAMLIQADLAHSLPFQAGSAALFFDPARRSNHQRRFSVEQYFPPLSVIKGWLTGFQALGVKISPGVDVAELHSYDAELEFISLRGELKEAVLWFGPLKSAFRRATLLPGRHQLVAEHADRLTGFKRITEPKSFLYEPDPAVIRAGLVGMLADILFASQLDPDIAYLTADSYIETPFARAWKVEDWFSFQLKKLRLYLRERNIGHVTVKKRGSPLEPEELIHQLHLKGDLERFLVLTHLRGMPIVIICNGL